MRGEFVYLHNEPTYYGSQGSRQATELSDKIAYVLGFDRNMFTNWMFSAQFAQFIHRDSTYNGGQVLNSYTYGLMDRVENVVTLKVATDFMYERIKPEVLVIYGDDGEGRVSFKTFFELSDNWWFTLGYHHFWGSPWLSYGQYRNRDHIYTAVKYTF